MLHQLFTKYIVLYQFLKRTVGMCGQWLDSMTNFHVKEEQNFQKTLNERR